MFPTQRRATPGRQQKAPFKLFDNVYSGGFQTVSIFLVTTSGSVVLIDTRWEGTVAMLLDNIRNAGFDPAQIRHLFVTHAASDPYGGAGRIKQLFPGVRIGTSGEDWDINEKQLNRDIRHIDGRSPSSTASPVSKRWALGTFGYPTMCSYGDSRSRRYRRVPGGTGGEGPHPAVIDPGRVDEHLDSIPSLMRRKMALEE